MKKIKKKKKKLDDESNNINKINNCNFNRNLEIIPKNNSSNNIEGKITGSII